MSNSDDYSVLRKPTGAQLVEAKKFITDNPWMAPLFCEVVRNDILDFARAMWPDNIGPAEELSETIDVVLVETAKWDLNEE